MNQPVMLSTWSFGQPANVSAWEKLSLGGSSLDAVETACRHAEADLSNPTVGAGAFPDATGRISLDAAIMLSPDHCGSVCFVRHYLHVISIARKVMERTPHILLAGQGAEDFAAEMGFAREDLHTEFSHQSYNKWLKERQGHYAPMPNIEEANHDTIGVLARDVAGVLAGGCTTSGMAFKRAGRVGDSPIVGHGMFVDPRHGACVCTGHGELVMGICGAFLAVEKMRDGYSPVDASKIVLNRMAESYSLTPDDQIGLILLKPNGSWSTASLCKGYNTALHTIDRNELIEPDFILTS